MFKVCKQNEDREKEELKQEAKTARELKKEEKSERVLGASWYRLGF